MPSRTPRVCNRCRRTVSAGKRCSCLPPKPQWQGTNGYTGTGSTRRWRNLRARKLQVNPLCEAAGCTRLATEVDHIRNVGAGGDRYAWANLQSLCTPHHREKTQTEAHKRPHNLIDDPAPF